MIRRVSKISILGCVALVTALVATADAETAMNGFAEVSYVDYSAEVDGKEVFSGNSLAQKYSINWMSTNLYFRNQPRYYKVVLGYDWTAFTTEINDSGKHSELSQVFGKFRYNGEVGFNPVEQPLRFRAYANNGDTSKFRNNIYAGLMEDGLTASIDGMTKGYIAGFSLAYESDRSPTAAIRQLPRVYVDYRELVNKPVENGGILNDKTSEFSVAGLNKENNWLLYRSTKYENYRNANDTSESQQIQIGLVDRFGRRKWAALTNWINVSADGSFFSRKMNNTGEFTEEYDVNFLATASRRNWEARTLMNYNRQVDMEKITEVARVPIYVKGIWDSSTDWYVNVAADRGRELDISGVTETLYRNHLAVGTTMFKRSAFTLAPMMSMTFSKQFRGADIFNLDAGVDTTSTRSYSNKVNLSAGYHIKYRDDGMNSTNSISWSNLLTMRMQHSPTSRFSYNLSEELEYGKGSAFIPPGDVNKLALAQGNQQYMQATTHAALKYVFSSALYTTLNASHGYAQTTYSQAENSAQAGDIQLLSLKSKSDQAANSQTAHATTNWFKVTHSLNYAVKDTTFSMTTNYDNGDIVTRLSTGLQMQYRPNRYNDLRLQSSYEQNTANGVTSSGFTLKQNYAHNIFAKSGLYRNIATISEELSLSRSTIESSTIIDSNYLMLMGRYSPTERVSLYGSVKYQKDLDALTLFYNGGVAVDFKLLSTSLDYYLAKRDVDNRIEKKLSASVRRSF